MMSYLNRPLLSFFVVLIVLAGCRNGNDYWEFDGLPYINSDAVVSHTVFDADTLLIDASSSSLSGRWMLEGKSLYYFDYNVVGLREYDSDGNFVARHIRSGRGPNEWVAPFVAADFLQDCFAGIDGNWFFTLYDSTYRKINDPYRMLSDRPFSNVDWGRLLVHPDPEEYNMYEFNFSSRGMRHFGDTVIVPIVTDHIRYNGYMKGPSSRKFWKHSYTFMTVDVLNAKTGRIFGHYPPVYHERNIPGFSKYSFDVAGDSLMIVSFAADSSMLVYGKDLQPAFRFGRSAEGFRYEFPQTSSPDEYSERRREFESSYSNYKDVKVCGDYVIRSCRIDGNRCALQIYENWKLKEEIAMSEPASILGMNGGRVYLSLPPDIDRDIFRIVRIKI